MKYFFLHNTIIDDDELFEVYSDHEKKTLNYNIKDKSTHRTKSLQTEIDLYFLREMKSDEIRNNIF